MHTKIQRNLPVFALILALLSLSPGSAYSQSCTPPPTGQVSWWMAENNAADAPGANKRTLMNGAGFCPPGPFGQTFSFDGQGGHVRVPDAVNLHFTNALTIEAWVNPTDSGTGAQHDIVSKWDEVAGPNQRSYDFAIGADGLPLLVVDSDGQGVNDTVVYGTSPIPANQWSHIAATYDGVALSIFVNGDLQNKVSAPDELFPGTDWSGHWREPSMLEQYRSVNVHHIQPLLIDDASVYNLGNSVSDSENPAHLPRQAKQQAMLRCGPSHRHDCYRTKYHGKNRQRK